MDIIQVKDVTYKYPVSRKPSLEQVCLNIKQGELCAVIGPNGGGKSTLCSVIRGLIPNFHKGDMTGDVFVKGKNLKTYSPGELACNIGFIFQNPFSQISGIKETVFEEIAFGLENLGVDPAEMRSRVEETIGLLKIESLADKNPFELSGGQLQRVALASVIVMEPDILVIDEPTSQLDPQGTQDVFQIISLMKKRDKTIVLVEHKMELIAEFADHVVLIDDGKIIMDGPARDVLSSRKLKEHNTLMPQFALLGHELTRQGYCLDKIPVTLKESYAQITQLSSRVCQKSGSDQFGSERGKKEKER